MLKIKAEKNPSIDIPVTNFAANKTTSALITKENKPSVRIVNGNPNILRIGVTIKFNIPNIKAKTKAVEKLSI